MAKFKYRMQNILNIKERLETQAKTEYAEKLGRLHEEEEAMRMVMAKLHHYEQQARGISKDKLDLNELRRCNDAIRIVRDQAKNQAVRVKAAERNVEIAMQKLTEAVQERKVQEKLKEHAFEEFKLELNAQEMKEIDEVVSFNYNSREA